MKVPIEVEGQEPEVEAEQVAEATTENDAEVAEAVEAEVIEDVEEDEEAAERARVEAAIRAGEEAAEAELADDAKKIREERDELQKQLASVQDQIDAAKKQASEATERQLRLQADWENYRRRTAAERLAEKQLAAEKLVCNLLPVIDDMERALEHAGNAEGDDQMKAFVDGVSAVHDKMVAVLAKEGVEAVDPAGQAFDPLSHQAVGRVEDASAYDETVAQVYQKGYKMGEKVIRSAMVTVTFGGPKRPAETPAEDAGDAEAPEAQQN